MHLTIQPQAGPPTVVIEVIGELDVASGPLLRTTITRSLDEQGGEVRLDLTRVTFVDAAGIQALARAQAEAAIRGTRLEITEWGRAFDGIAVRSAVLTITRAQPALDA